MSYTSATRLTGLASGIDTDSYVKQLMHAESTRYYNYQRKVQKVQWQQEIYRTHIKSISDFQTKWLDVASSTNVRLQKNFNNKYKTSAVLGNGSETKNIAVSDVKGSGSHTIEVLSAATAATIHGQQVSNATTGEKLSTSDKLSDVLGSDFVETIKLADNVSITVDENTTVKEFMDKINKSEAGVKMTYNSIARVFTLESAETGSTGKIDITDESGVLKALGFDTGTDGKLSKVGTDAELIVDGVKTTSATNKLEFDEFTVDIKNATANETVTVNSDKDVDAIYGMLKDFVDGYNSLIEGIKKETTTSRPEGANGYYEPLTDAEKEEMDEDDIKKWEEQAKKGLLYRDDYLEKFLSNARTSIYEASTTDSKGNKVGIYNYGITTSSDTSQGGKLVIDEEKLKKAISEEPEAVTALINDIAGKLDDVADKYIGTGGLLTVKVGIEGKGSEFDNYMRTEINGIKDKMALELERLKEKEERYYMMFASMEDKVSSNNSLLDTLYSFTG